MRVLHVVKAYDEPVTGIELGGLEATVRLLTQQLSRTMEVEVVTCAEGPPRIDYLSERLRVIRVPRLFTAFRVPVAPGLRSKIAERAPDLIHLHHPYPFAEFSCLFARTKAPIVITWHSDVLKPRIGMMLYGPFLRALLKRAGAILTSSPQYLEISKYLGDFREKCHIVPFGIEPSAFALGANRAARCQQLRDEHRGTLVLFVGRFVYYKGLPYLIRAMTQVDGHLLLVGDGPDRPMLEELVRELGLQDKVSMHIRVSDAELPDFYHACDMFVLPSVAITEAFGIVQLEAMVCGKPVISTQLPTGVVFVNQDGKTGLVVPPADEQALAGAINRLAGDAELRTRLGSHARERVLKEFTVERYVGRVRDIYCSLLASRDSIPDPCSQTRQGTE